jgi:hypothetical protein
MSAPRGELLRSPAAYRTDSPLAFTASHCGLKGGSE